MAVGPTIGTPVGPTIDTKFGVVVGDGVFARTGSTIVRALMLSTRAGASI
jgi:hypothetical protein